MFVVSGLQINPLVGIVGNQKKCLQSLVSKRDPNACECWSIRASFGLGQDLSTPPGSSCSNKRESTTGDSLEIHTVRFPHTSPPRGLQCMFLFKHVVSIYIQKTRIFINESKIFILQHKTVQQQLKKCHKRYTI